LAEKGKGEAGGKGGAGERRRTSTGSWGGGVGG